MEEEIDCLAAIYGRENVTFDAALNMTEIALTAPDLSCTIRLHLPESYPDGAPTRLVIRFDPAASKEFSSRAEERVMESLASCLGDPYQMNAVMALQEFLAENPASSMTDAVVDSPPNGADEGNLTTTTTTTITTTSARDWVVIVKLDHMRNRQKYLKHLKKWSNELCVGVSVFVLKEVRFAVILRGDRRDVDQFLVNWKTQCVDVDAKGKPCKEKLMTVCRSGFADAAVGADGRFAVRESDHLSDFEGEFENLGSDYRSDVRTIFS